MMDQTTICKTDAVDNPRGYQGRHGLKAWQVLANFRPSDPDSAIMWGQIILYLLRYERKNARQDLLKARAWLNELIAFWEGVPSDSLFGRSTQTTEGLPETKPIQEELKHPLDGDKLPGTVSEQAIGHGREGDPSFTQRVPGRVIEYRIRDFPGKRKETL